MNELPEKWWRLYREERVKIVLAKHPEMKPKQTFRVRLNAQETTRAAREANRRYKEQQ